jgi:hypothetical protein
MNEINFFKPVFWSIKKKCDYHSIDISLQMFQEKTSPLQFFSTLTMFTRSESLSRGTGLWKQVSDWLKTVAEQEVKNWTTEDIKACIRNQITKHLTPTKGL